MKLLTKEIIAKLEKSPLYSHDGFPPATVPIIVKFFVPWNNWTWFATEAEFEDGDVRFYGMVHGHEKELGYFLLSELAAVRGPGGLRIERDMYYDGHVLAEVMPSYTAPLADVTPEPRPAEEIGARVTEAFTEHGLLWGGK